MDNLYDAEIRDIRAERFRKSALDFGKTSRRAAAMLQEMHTMSLELQHDAADAYLRNRLSAMVDLLQHDVIALKAECAYMTEAYTEILNAGAD